MGRMGVGRHLMPLGVAYTGLAGLFSYLYPQVFRIPLPYWLLAAAGSLLLVGWLVMWIASMRSFMSHVVPGKLCTNGAFAWCANPMYATWILFFVPGLSLICASWLMLLGAVGGYVSFKMLIGREYDFMASTFGREYGDYRAGVNEFFPWPYNRGKGEAL